MNKYQSVGVQKGFNPVDATKLRMFVVGPFGSGKTTFVGSRPRNLILSSEQSANFLVDAKADYVMVRNYREYKGVMDVLRGDKDNPDRPYDCVTFDPVDMFLSFFDSHLCTQYGGGKLQTIMDFGSGGKGVSILRQMLEDQMTDLEAWGYSWMMVSFVTEKLQRTIDGGEFAAPRISLYPSLKDAICRKADYVLLTSVEARAQQIKSDEPILDKDGNPRVKPNGDPMVRSISKSEIITNHYLDVTPGYIPDTKQRIKIDSNILMESGNGWQQFKDVYDAKVQEYKK